MSGQTRVLHIDDNAFDRELVRDSLEQDSGNFSVTSVSSWNDFCRRFDEEVFDLILTDFNIAGVDGLKVLEYVKRASPSIPVIVLTGTGTEEIAVQAMKLGAADYVLKTVHYIQNLERTLTMVLAGNRTRQELAFKSIVLESVQENSIDGILVVNNNDEIVSFNPRFNEIWDIPRDILSQRSGVRALESVLGKVVDPEGFVNRIEYLMQHSHEKTYDEISLRDGRTLERYCAPLTGPDDIPHGKIWYYRDITERRRSERNILRLNRMLGVLSAINGLIVRAPDRQSLFTEACNIAVNTGGFRMAWIGLLPPGEAKVTPQAWAGHEAGYLKLFSVPITADLQAHSATIECLLTGKAVIRNDIANAPDEDPLKREAITRGYRGVAAFPLQAGSEVAGLLGLYASEPDFFNEQEISLLTELADDISYALQNLAKQERLEYLITYDSLTGLPHRDTFLRRLEFSLKTAMGNGEPVALLVFNIQRFQDINNVFGRNTGDALLIETANRLKSLVDNPANLTRMTANTFAILLGNQTASAAGQFFDGTLTTTLSAPFRSNQNSIRINVNGGISVFPADGKTAEDIYRGAEVAMERAREEGKPWLHFRSEMADDIAAKMRLLDELRMAMENMEFFLQYLPRYDLPTGRISGLEALIRWNSPRRGIVPPADFIPLLEESEMILDVSKWALEKAVVDWRRWSKRIHDSPRITINLSPAELRHKNFLDKTAVAHVSNEDPVILDYKITENHLMLDIDDTERKLGEIRKSGSRIIIDDFGSGYSSLSYITRVPADFLKIDRSFIMTMADQPDSMAIVSTIITLAHSLNLKVIAEGIETEEQAKYLRLLRCDEMQGFLYSRPLSSGAVLRLLETEQEVGLADSARAG